jgi:hypothetical protein
MLTAGRMRHDLMLVFCIPAVFVAMVMGFSLGIYALETFGGIQAVASPVLAWFGAKELARRYDARERLDFRIANEAFLSLRARSGQKPGARQKHFRRWNQRVARPGDEGRKF